MEVIALVSSGLRRVEGDEDAKLLEKFSQSEEVYRMTFIGKILTFSVEK